MPQIPFFGTYATFTVADTTLVGTLLGADCIVGDELTAREEWKNGKRVVVISNKFGCDLGYIQNDFFIEQFSLAHARGWQTSLRLASLYFDQNPHPGTYGGEVVFLAFEQTVAESFIAFSQVIGQKLANGIRPTVDLSSHGVEQVIASQGQWIPNTRQAPLQKEGRIFLKSERSLNETLVDLSRRRAPGCLIAGWGFIIFLILALLWVIHLITGIF